MIIKTSFGQWLKQRRKTLDLTREDLANRISCAPSTIYKIEAGERRPSKQIAELLAEYLNIPLDERAEFVHFARAEAAESDAPFGTPFHPPTNLPTPPTTLIGREDDVSTVRNRLLQPDVRLLTLTGPPGIGKTRLALQVATTVLDDFTDGVFLIALAPIADPQLVPTTIANTLGVPEVGSQTPLERLKAFLRDKQTLLVVDNFEQILVAAPPIAELLAVCPWLKILVTSRAPLRIRQERQMPLSPLALPDLARLPDVETVTRYAAVALFIERAQAVKPDFMLTSENTPTVAAICTRLDGLPLAIELVSARIKLLAPASLLDRLHGRLMLQFDGMRDLEPRHRTLNAAIEWSYQLLSVEEQRLLQRLGVFVGGWTIEAAEAICAENLDMNMLDGLASLLDKNLIKRDSESRFMMLETIREYALEKLTASGELDYLHQQHLAYFTALAEHAGSNRVQWLNHLDAELDNLRAALTLSETRLRLAVALGTFWQQRAHLSEASAWLTNALAQQELGTLSTADRTLRATALSWLGTFRSWQGNFDAAELHHEQSVIIFRDLGDCVGLTEALCTYGMLLVMRGDHDRAAPALEEALSLSRELKNTWTIAQSTLFLGNLAYSQGHVQRASALWEESLALHRADGNTWLIAIALAFLAMAALEQGNDVRAHLQLVESLTLLQGLGEKWQTTHTLELFACLAVMRTQPNLIRAAQIFGAAQVLRETLSAPILPFLQHFNERSIAALRAQLDESTLSVAWAEGRAMTLDQMITYALES